MDRPLNKIKVRPLASESLGVRSMCTSVETPNLVVMLDAGVSLCPWRFNLPPHPIEFQTINRLRQVIADVADKAAIITISHYHFDHHTPSYEDWVVNWTDSGETARQIYQDKIIYAKNPKENINASQRKRAWMFQKTGGKYAKSVEAADGKTFRFGSTKLSFSEAVPHGAEDGILGSVIMTIIEFEDERFMHAPDVQGPMSNRTTEMILATKPDVIMLGGPPLYLSKFRVTEQQLKQGVNNLMKIAEAVPIVILEHHILRDEFWRPKIEEVFQTAKEAGHSIVTAAEYSGKENLFLEAKRPLLYSSNPPSSKFMAWTKTLNEKKIGKPPL
jgi:predicted metallo-beta-lactamase superfamily hydrolase